MKYGNFYDLESLTLLNRHEGCACSIKECDVEKVNRLISRMREDRERAGLPTAGDVVTYITRGGDYYPQAHIERGDDREVHICLLPQTPFCHENEKCTGYNTEGGPWVTTGPELLIPDGIRSKQFRMWGHTGRHRNGAVLFHTFVRAWKYTEPDPLYGKYTTKEWTRYIIECQPDIEPADAFVYRNEAFTLYSREELERLGRGLNPWPSAFTFINGKTLKVWKASVLKTQAGKVPGTVLAADKEGIQVACGQNVLVLHEVQLEGKKRMEVDAFLRGYQLKPGDMFKDSRE